MSTTFRKSAVLATTALAIGVLLAPAAGQAAAKTYKVNAKFAGYGAPLGPVIHAKVSDKALGKCTMTGKLVIPDTTQTWKCKGGSVKIKGHGTTGAEVNAKGTWKVVGGTGKYKGAKGKGTFKGSLTTSKFVYSGSFKV